MYGRRLPQIDGYKQTDKAAAMQEFHRGMPSANKDKEVRRADYKHRVGDNKMNQNYNKSSNHVQKANTERKQHKPGALRECGDWSQHVSSSGKIYFYNNKTNVSKWEKPKEWDDSKAINLKPNRPKPSTHKGGVKNNRSMHANKNSTDTDYRNHQASKDYQDRDYRSKTTGSSDRDYRDVDYRDSGSKTTNSRTNDASSDKDYRGSGGGGGGTSTAHSRSHMGNSFTTTQVGSNGQSLVSGVKSENYKPTTGEYYDYSNWDGNCPPPLKSEQQQQLSQNNATPLSTENNSQSSQHSADLDRGGGAGGGNSDTSLPNSQSSQQSKATSAFVRQLSNVLNKAAGNKSNNAATNANKQNSSKSTPEQNLKNALQLLLDAASKNQAQQNEANGSDNHVADKKEDGEPPAKKPCNADNEVSSQDSSSGDGGGKTNDEVDSLPPLPLFTHLYTLRDTFDPNTVRHIQNWPSEPYEKQSQHIALDYHKFMAHNMSDLNAQLVTSRSHVRSSEILSVIQEQRLLYLRQQIKDLQKTSSSSSNSSSNGPFT